MNKRSGIQEINKICEAVLKLTDADFKQVGIMVRGQTNYNNPLKPATSQRQQELGDHNTRVIDALHTLRETIKAGKDI